MAPGAYHDTLSGISMCPCIKSTRICFIQTFIENYIQECMNMYNKKNIYRNIKSGHGVYLHDLSELCQF